MQIANPPLFGIIAGILVGVSPLGVQLFQSESAIAIHRAAQLPTELRTCLGEAPNARCMLNSSFENQESGIASLGNAYDESHEKIC